MRFGPAERWLMFLGRLSQQMFTGSSRTPDVTLLDMQW
jgi:hypothetical protein